MLGLVLFLKRVTISRRLDVQTKARQRYGSRRLRVTRLTAVHCPGPVAQVNRAWRSRRSAFLFIFIFNSFFFHLYAHTNSAMYSLLLKQKQIPGGSKCSFYSNFRRKRRNK